MRHSSGQHPALSAAAGTIADRVVEVLVDHIRRNRLAAGAPLPSEIQTSTQLRVSRGIVREAYRSLSSAGLVKIANGSSPRVGHVTNRALTQLLQHAMWTRQTTAEQILELRGPIELRAAELAAERRTAEDIDALATAAAAMRAAGMRRELYVKADIAFHEAIGKATGNPLFWLVGSALRQAMSVSIRVSLAGRRSRAELDRVIGTHERLVEAIRNRDTAAARRLMRRHYREARTAIGRSPR